MSDNKTSSGGIGFTGCLLIAFIVLKLCNVIAWSWWWVLSPAWIGAGIVVLLLALLGVIHFIDWKKSKKVVTGQGELKSKWQQRLDEVQAAKNQKALDEKMIKNKGDEFRANNIV